MSDGFKIADAFVEVHLDDDAIGRETRAINERVSADLQDGADRSGNDSGGMLAQGMRSGFIRNSPLIVAAVSGVLAAGAPVMLAAASTMFAGIGIVAAAQTEAVQTAFSGMWGEIKAGAISDSQVLVPVLVGIADQVGAAFQDLRPQLRDVFSDVGPQIETLTDGLLGLVQNAMPGLAAAVGSADPVFEGLKSLLESTGTGLSEFFTILSEHAPAAGEAFSAIGDILGALLPILGSFLGSGAELASTILPPLAAALQVVAGVLQVLEPILPVVAAGFLAFKVVNSVSGMMTTFGTSLATVRTNLTNFAAPIGAATGAMGKMTAGAGAMTSALGGPWGVALAAGAIMVTSFVGDLNEAADAEDQWAQAILAGGQAAIDAQAAYDDGTHWGQALDEATGLAESWNDAKDKAAELYAAMSPLQQKQTDLTKATNEARLAAETYGQGSPQHVAALNAQDVASAELTAEQNRLESAVTGVNTAMVEQANQALAAIDSGFAYRNSVNQLEDAQATLAETIANRTNADVNLRTSEEDVARAQLAVEEQSYRTALSFAQQQADVSGLKEGTAEYDQFIQQQLLASLVDMQSKAGPEMQAALQTQIDALRRSGVAINDTATLTSALTRNVDGLSGSVTAVPGQKFVRIDAPTEAQVAAIEGLGYKVTHMPNGDIYVSANTADAERAAALAARDRTATIFYRASLPDLNGSASGSGRSGLATGGPVQGPGTSTSDSVPAMLSDGEWVVKATAVQKYGHAFMSALNSGRLEKVQKFAGGGSVGRMAKFAVPSGQPTMRVFNYYAAPGESFTAEDAFFSAASRARMAL